MLWSLDLEADIAVRGKAKNDSVGKRPGHVQVIAARRPPASIVAEHSPQTWVLIQGMLPMKGLTWEQRPASSKGKLTTVSILGIHIPLRTIVEGGRKSVFTRCILLAFLSALGSSS